MASTLSIFTLARLGFVAKGVLASASKKNDLPSALKEKENLAFHFVLLPSNAERFIRCVKICQYVCISSLHIHMRCHRKHEVCMYELWKWSLYLIAVLYTQTHAYIFFLFLARSICKTTSLILSSHWCPSQWGVFRLSFMYPSHSHLGIFRAIWSACCRSRRIPHAFKTAVAGDFFQCCDWQAQEERSEGEGMGCGEGHSQSFGSDILQAHRLINQFPLKKGEYVAMVSWGVFILSH